MSEDPNSLTRQEGLYRQLADRLRRDIETGRYNPGDTLPSEAQLGDRYGVSRQTIRKAIALLQAGGLVEVEHGRGTFVRQSSLQLAFSRYAPARREPGRGPFEQTCADLGIDGYGELILVEQIPADDATATALSIPPGTTVVHRRRYMHAGPDIVQLQDGHFDLALVQGTPIADTDKLVHGTYAALEAIGHAPTTVTEVISARMPTFGEASVMRLKSGVPVIDIQRTTFGADNTALEYLTVIAAADKNRFTYDQLPLDPSP